MNKTLNPARNEGESFEHYRERQRAVHRVLKIYLRGRMVTPAPGPVRGNRKQRRAH